MRIALFTHDAFGLGHLRRSLHILNAVSRRAPDSALLLITGSPSVHMLEDLPRNADYLKIPSVATSGTGGDGPNMLPVGLTELTALRGGIVLGAVRAFAPDLFVVDNFPFGSRLELVPTLHECRARGIETALVMRDVLDPPDKVRTAWTRDGTYAAVQRLFSRILVCGLEDVFDPRTEYAFPPALAERVRFCGYVAASPPSPERRAELRRRLAGDARRVVMACAGGGGDGLPLLRAFASAAAGLEDTASLIVTGEFMPQADRRALEACAAEIPGLRVERFLPDLADHLAACDVVVAMGGYNTTAEIMAMGVPAVVVPRTWRPGEHAEQDPKRVDGEQLHRARLLSRAGYVEHLHPKDLCPETLRRAILSRLDGGRSAFPAGPLDGAEVAAGELLALAAGS